MKIFFHILKYLSLLVNLLVVCNSVNAQVDSIIELKMVQVNSSRNKDFSAGSKIIFIDSLQIQNYGNNNLSNLLNEQSGIFIKNYGLGALATSSIRGGSAYHTAVIWNGFNIANSLNGLVDFTLIKSFLVDEFSIQYGGSSALWGSGAVGGAVLINNKKEFNKGLSVSIGGSAGSFGNFQQNARLEWSSKKFNSSVKIINENAVNNFQYTVLDIKNDNENKKLKQVNNQLSQTGLLNENYLQLNQNNTVNVIGTYQKSQRQLAPTIYQTNNHASQNDEIFRLTTEWQHTADKFIVQTRAAYFDEKLLYRDDFLLNEGEDKSKSLIAETEVKYYLNNYHLLSLGANNTYVSAFSENYKGKIKQNQLAAFAAYKFQPKNESLQISLSARKGIQNNFVIPFTYTGGLNVTLLHGVIARGQFSKVYRIPTINDLYWNPGGNPGLLSESGFTEEIGIHIDLIKLLTQPTKSSALSPEKYKLLADVTYFNKNINDWIIWLPKGSVWSPRNILEVWSRGIETNIDFIFKKNTLQLGANTKLNYIVSTNQKSANKEDLSIGRQLIYVPMYASISNLFIGYKNFYFNYNHQYTGYRYTSSDNYQYLVPYQLHNLQISKSFSKKNTLLKLFFNINNVFNKSYQVLESRPMPLRNYQIGINLTINQINKK